MISREERAMQLASRSEDPTDLLVAADWLMERGETLNADLCREIGRLATLVANEAKRVMDSHLHELWLNGRWIRQRNQTLKLASVTFGNASVSYKATPARVEMTIYWGIRKASVRIHRDQRHLIPSRAGRLIWTWLTESIAEQKRQQP